MNYILPKITCPKFRILLLLRVWEIIYLGKEVQVIKRSAWEEIPKEYSWKESLSEIDRSLKRVKNSTSPVRYSSAIGLGLAARFQLEVPKLIATLVDSCGNYGVGLSSEDTELSSRILRDLTVRAGTTGLLVFEFGDRALGLWLEYWVDWAIRLERQSLEPDPDWDNSGAFSFTKNLQDKFSAAQRSQIFRGQYYHARCCSLIRMAQEAGVLAPAPQTVIHPGIQPSSAPSLWLTEAGYLSLQHPAERYLLSQMVTVVDQSSLTGVDDLTEIKELGEDLSSKRLPALRLATDLGDAFDRFHRIGQLWDSQSTDRAMAQRRLGLVILTRGLLEQLLRQHLGVAAPRSL